MVGTLLEEYVCPEDRLQFLTLLSALKGDRVVGVVRFCLSNQGIVSARIVIDPGSSRSTFAMTITEQTASSQEMVDGGQDGHRLAHAILEQTQDTIMVLDPGGRVLMSSPSARALVGRDPVGLDFFFALPLEPDLDPGAEGMHPLQGELPSRARAGPVPSSGLYRFPACEGRQIRVRVDMLTPSDDARGVPPGSVVRLDDITARLEEEGRLKRARETAAASNRELQQFVYAASHDLQEPLRMITSYLQLLERRHARRLDEEGLEFIGFAVDGARRMQELIDALLVYSRVISRARPPARVDTRSVIAEALARIEQKVNATQAEITVGHMPIVQADRAQLVLVFEHLIDNALTYRSDAPPRIRIDAERVDESTWFRVQDNGIGIDPEFHERIFQLFSRLHARDQYPGSGVGLAVVQRIVERHGGRCWVESSEGAGSTFFFSLPDHPRTEEA
ncbi:MAG: ATP-binding protein [Methanoregulaceae archaeon]